MIDIINIQGYNKFIRDYLLQNRGFIVGLGLRGIFGFFASKLPVIGPHADIETELMLAGTKPLTWVSVETQAPYAPTEKDIKHAEEEQKAHLLRQKLDKDAAAGKCISADLELDIGSGERKQILRFYALPGQEEDLWAILEHSKAVMTGEPAVVPPLPEHLQQHMPTGEPLHLRAEKLQQQQERLIVRLPVYPDEINLSWNYKETERQRKEHEGRLKLDLAVAEGKLKATDVIVYNPRGNNVVYRHYCQIGREEDMMLIARYNQKAFNFQEPDVKLTKDMGEYLGYRKKDIQLFHALNKIHCLPRPLSKALTDAIFFINKNITQSAYQARAVKKAAVSPGDRK